MHRDTWDYRSAYIEIIQNAITDFDRKHTFSNNSANDNVCFFCENLKDIFSNYMAHRTMGYKKSK